MTQIKPPCDAGLPHPEHGPVAQARADRQHVADSRADADAYKAGATGEDSRRAWKLRGAPLQARDGRRSTKLVRAEDFAEAHGPRALSVQRRIAPRHTEAAQLVPQLGVAMAYGERALGETRGRSGYDPLAELYADRALPRPRQEDAFVARWVQLARIWVIGVFDGHADHSGSSTAPPVARTAKLLARAAPRAIAASVAARRARLGKGEELDDAGFMAAISDAFTGAGNPPHHLAALTAEHYDEGSTATVAVVADRRVFVANVGDSRALLVTDAGRVRRLTVDHRASDPLEAEQLVALRGEDPLTAATGRVGGVLAMSRSVGDANVTPLRHPSIVRASVQKDIRRLVLVSDGVSNAISDPQVGAASLTCRDPQALARLLVLAAGAADEQDNKVALVVDLEAAAPR